MAVCGGGAGVTRVRPGKHMEMGPIQKQRAVTIPKGKITNCATPAKPSVSWGPSLMFIQRSRSYLVAPVPTSATGLPSSFLFFASSATTSITLIHYLNEVAKLLKILWRPHASPPLFPNLIIFYCNPSFFIHLYKPCFLQSTCAHIFSFLKTHLSLSF
ncbi:unnamed protein product [Citrullus colocynthis]|uniref:Uncharacterized protein n=1 Tax=Citrullus colocynthis TaxID=252529 RepID=A0ABP0YPB4_9ROSI